MHLEGVLTIEIHAKGFRLSVWVALPSSRSTAQERFLITKGSSFSA